MIRYVDYPVISDDKDAIAAEEAAIAGDTDKSSRLIDESERYIDRAVRSSFLPLDLGIHISLFLLQAKVFGLKYTGIVGASNSNQFPHVPF